MFSALLDTCVLVPSRARDVLLEIASTGAYRPLWSTEILAELDRTLRLLLGKRGTSPEETDAYLTRLFRQMETTFPDALVTGWEPLAATVMLPDPDDRHVVAAAWAGRADVIVTDNLAHFPPAALPVPLARQSLDDFLLDSLDLHPGQAVAAVRAVARRTGKSGPAMTDREVGAYLREHGMPAFGERLLAELDRQIQPEPNAQQAGPLAPVTVSPGTVLHGLRGNDRCAAASTGPSSSCQGQPAAPTAPRCSRR
jgi:predicted nucleic acid-binding protein